MIGEISIRQANSDDRAEFSHQGGIVATQDYAKIAQSLLEAADREFDAERIQKASGLMWEAARSSLLAVADKHGLPCQNLDDLKNVVRFLDREHTEYPVHLAHFNVAEGFRENADCLYWEDGEFDMRRKSVKEFVAMLAKYTGAG